jgi:cytochrome oxidase Cu insertion factor (SCO1/SenC/PrrC family)
MRVLSRIQPAIAALVGRPVFWVAFVAILFALPLGRSLARTLPPAPRVLGEVQPFELEDQYGHRLGTQEMRFQTWVISFASADEGQSTIEQMKALRTIVYRTRNLGSTFHMVTFPLDATKDSQDARRKAVEAHCSSSRLWAFLGGPADKVALAMHAVLGPLHLDAPPEGQLILIDGSGRIRGLYGTDKPSIDRLMQDVGYVVNLP